MGPRVETRHVAPPEGRRNAIFAPFMRPFWGRGAAPVGIDYWLVPLLFYDFLQPIFADLTFKVSGYICRL